MKKMMFTTAVLAAAMAFSCNDKGVLEPENYPDFVVIDGDTIKTREDNSKARRRYANYEFAPIYTVYGDTVITYRQATSLLKPTNLPKLDKIKDNEDGELKGKPFRIFAIGDGVLTGYRDGGLFNEGMLTSMPNLLANQMGVDFRQPYFDSEDYNGFNRRVVTTQNLTGGPLPKYKIVKNNVGIDKVEKNNFALLKPTKITRIDNFATPNNLSNDGLMVFGKRIAQDYTRGFSFQKMPEIIKANKADFYVIHDAFEASFSSIFFISNKLYFGNSSGTPRPQGTEGYKFHTNPIVKPDSDLSQRIEAYIKILGDKSIKRGVILNTPDFFDTPYLNIVKVEDIQAAYEFHGLKNILPVRGMSYVIPTGEIDSLLGNNVHPSLKKGINKNLVLNEKNFITTNAVNYWKEFITLRNQETASLAKELNIAVVDIYSLYKAIHEGSYISDDNQKVTVESFYSSDGFYPSAHGQAIITNETIKVINKFYGTEIPLIETRPFLQK